MPTKFEDIFAKPSFVLVKGKGGLPDQVMTAEEFSRQAIKDGSALDLTRERLKTEISNPSFGQIFNSITPTNGGDINMSPNIGKENRPKPFSKLKDTDDMSSQSTTMSPIQSPTFSTILPLTRIPFPPMPTTKNKIRFHFFNHSVTTTTPLPKTRKRPLRPASQPIRINPSTTTTRRPSRPTLVTTISSVVTKTIGNVKDKMKAARNRLRSLIGAKPIGTTSRPRGRPGSSENEIQKQREKLLAMLEQQKEDDIKAAAAAAGINIDEDYFDEEGIVIPLDTGSFNKQNRPSIPLEFPRRNKLNKPLRENSNGKINGLEAPSQKQDPLLGTLISNAKENFKNFKTPPRKQNTLLKNLRTNFRKIKQKNPDRTINLSVPSRTRRPPQSSSFDPDILSTPNKRQNPLLKILRFDQRERTLRKGLSPPNFKQYPLFQQVVRTPQKYHKDFLQLPPKEQNKLMEILHRYGGDRFDADALLVPPIQLIKEKTKPRFHFFNNSITTTTPLPKLRQQPFLPKAVAPTESNRNSGKFRTKVVVPSKSTTSPQRITTSSLNVQRRPKIQPNIVESDSAEEEESLKKGRALDIFIF